MHEVRIGHLNLVGINERWKSGSNGKINGEKWRRFCAVLDCMVSMIAITIGQIVGEVFFDDKFIPKMCICVLSVLILTPVNQLLQSAVYRSDKLRKQFEDKE